MMGNFRYFLLNEEQGYLGQKVGDVLTSMQDIQSDMDNFGARHLTRLAEELVNQIRKILHSQWAVRSHKHLEELQKIAVAIQKTIDEKGELKEVLPAAAQAMQDLSGKLGVKVNDLEAPPEQQGGEEISQDDFELTGDGQNQEQPAPPGSPLELPPAGGQMPPGPEMPTPSGAPEM